MNKRFQTTRPLLNVQRFEIRQFILFWKLPIYPDQSNEKTNFLRNKVRKQLMPTLRIFFNPQIDRALTNFTEITKDEQLYFLAILSSLLKNQKTYPCFVLFIDQECTYYKKGLQSNTTLVTSKAKTSHDKVSAGLSRRRKAVSPKVTQETRREAKIIRNQIFYELIVKNSTVNMLYSYPYVFQRRILKQFLKTFTQVENALIESNKKKLAHLLIMNSIKKLLTQKEKKALLLLLSRILLCN